MLMLEEPKGHDVTDALPTRRRSTVLRGSLGIVATYLVFGALWILLSDRLLTLLVSPSDLPLWQSLKGLLFITITAVMLFLLVRRQLAVLARALRASRESEQRFRSMFRRTSVALIEFDDRELQLLLNEWRHAALGNLKTAFANQPNLAVQALTRFRIVGINPEARRLFGIADRAELAQLAARLFNVASYPVLAELLQALQDHHTRFVDELVVTSADGSRHEMQLTAGFPATESGHHAMISLTDMSVQRRAEARHQLLQHLSHEVSLCPDLDSALQLTLQRLCEAGGWQFGQAWQPSEEGDVLACNELFFATEERLAEFNRRSREFAFMRGRGLPGRVWQQRQPIWLRDVTLDSNFPRSTIAEQCGLRTAAGFPLLRNGQIAFVLEFFGHDVRREDRSLLELMASACVQLELVLTAKQQMQALQRAEQHLQLAMNAVEFGFWEWHIATGRVRWQGNVERMFGLSEGGFDGRMESYLALLPTDDRGIVEQAIATALNGSSDSFQVQHRIRLGDGQYRWLEGRGRVFRDATGQPSAMAGTVADITEQQLDERVLPALAAATTLTDPVQRKQQLLTQLAAALSADHMLMMRCDGHLCELPHREWPPSRNEQPDEVLSATLIQQLLQSPATHYSSVREHFSNDSLLAANDTEDLLAAWLNPQDVTAGVLLLLFRRRLTHPKRMLALLQLTTHHLLPQ